MASDGNIEAEDMIELPMCRWRGDYHRGTYPCSSPLLIVPSGSVSEETCAKCEVRDAGGQRVVVRQIAQKSVGSRPYRLWRFGGQVLSYLQAKARWVAAGCPQPTPEQLAEREATCRTCPSWNSGRDGCGKCGCGIDGGSLDEKRRMATEECPDEPPRWKALV